MAGGSPSNEDILQQLRQGIARFELTSAPVAPIFGNLPRTPAHILPPASTMARFFAWIGQPADMGSPAMEKVERYSVRKVTGDGRCLFRALVKGMALNKGMVLGPREERDSADELRMAVKEVICENGNERLQYQEAYCQRIGRPDFWGGEAELLHGGLGSGFIPIQEYGSEFRKASKNEKPRSAVRLLYTGRNHYDLLV
ncbi:cysteine proteinases superfamily protein [Striga asiatica]|uniref:Ubiquitin thioesterase OTU n=1 Tax=Striga asiatica TaxID=4170 RepID=A0A5A7NZP3_STRAF|nr:cysteine proteinases superfamily protein [Striga asiatica]